MKIRKMYDARQGRYITVCKAPKHRHKYITTANAAAAMAAPPPPATAPRQRQRRVARPASLWKQKAVGVLFIMSAMGMAVAFGEDVYTASVLLSLLGMWLIGSHKKLYR